LCGPMLIHGVMAILPARRIISPFLTIIKAMAARSRSPSLDTVFAPDFPRSRIMGSDDQKVSPAIWMFKIRAVTVATGPVFAHQDKNGGKNGRSDNQRHSKRYS
jgi:hypothetical protein